MIRRLLKLPLMVWHRWIAPAFPPCCRFYPSCSVYAMEAIDRLPLHRALLLIVWRVVRCNPFHSGGYDPVPGCDPADDLSPHAHTHPASKA